MWRLRPWLRQLPWMVVLSLFALLPGGYGIENFSISQFGNVLLFYTGTKDLRDVSETLSSYMKKVDALASVPYDGDLRESIFKNHKKFGCMIF